LICHASRVLLSIILNRLRQYSERELSQEQTGFRAGKGTRDALFVLQLVIEKTIDVANKELYLTFIDYRKAFDMVNHKKIFDVMLSMGIPRHLVELRAGLYSNQEAAVRWNGQLTGWFPIGRGTREKCNISPIEFNLYAERIMREVNEENIKKTAKESW